MTRIEEHLRQARKAGGKSFIPFVTAGDPDLPTSERIILALAKAGAAAIEVGVPFTDPVADGPVIQRASLRALAAGTTVDSVLDLCGAVSRQTTVPIVLFSYLNPLLAFGLERLAAVANEKGISAVLPTDLPFDVASPLREHLLQRGVDLISIIAPNSSEAHLASVAREATGFLYLVTRSGVTGHRSSHLDSLRPLVECIRRITDVPLALGFGIATPEEAVHAWQLADCAVVGSALVSLIEKHLDDDRDSLIHAVADYVGQFVAALPPLPQRGRVAF